MLVNDSYNLAVAHFKAGNLIEARQNCEHVLRKNPHNADAFGLLGTILSRIGDMNNAIRSYQSGLSIAPTRLDIRDALASCLINVGQFDQAILQWKYILNVRPDLINIRFNLAQALMLSGLADDAILQFEAIVAQEPSHPNLSNLAAGLFSLGRKEEAAEVYRKALTYNPNEAMTHRDLATTWRELGETENADTEYHLAISLGNRWGHRVENATLLPIVYDSVEQIAQWRRRLTHEIEVLRASPISLNNPYVDCEYSDFYFAYQALNNKDIKTSAAAMFKKACPRLNLRAPHCDRLGRRYKRIRVGFISSYFGDHSTGRMVKGFIEQMDRTKFEIFVILVPPVPNDAYNKYIRDCADHVITVKLDLWEARQEIARLELDALLYFDIGMDRFSYFLAFARLAPIQCSCFGHPETTGIDNIDFIISADSWESNEAESHYSEKLLRLTGVSLPSYYYRPFGEERHPNARSRLNLPTDARIYLCPQTVYKFHPDFDDTIRRILEADSQGIFVCVETKEKNWTDKLATRFKRTLGHASERVRFLPRQKGKDWPSLAASVDVVIDTPHFSGMITTLDILSVGTPVITWAGEFARGRQTSGIYKDMGIQECTANSQIECASLSVEIANNPDHRRYVSEKITNRLPEVFEDSAVISQIETFLEQELDKVSR